MTSAERSLRTNDGEIMHAILTASSQKKVIMRKSGSARFLPGLLAVPMLLAVSCAGPPGPAGPQGEPGLSGREVVSAPFFAEGQPPCPPNALCALQKTKGAAVCPPGKNVFGGGYTLDQNQLVSHEISASRPIDASTYGYNATGPGWGVEIVNYETKTPNDRIGFTVYAVCATSR